MPSSVPQCWLQITAGRGPDECAWVVARLLPVLIDAAECAGLTHAVLDAVPGSAADIYRSVLLRLEGKMCLTWAAQWSGTIQWIGKSPFRPRHKRKNWYVGVHVMAPPKRTGQLSGRDIVVQAMQASGPGGQHVNKTASAVRITHVPTGLSVIAQEERSQHRNKQLALTRLALRLAEQTQEATEQAEHERWSHHNTLQRGNPTKVFVGPKFICQG